MDGRQQRILGEETRYVIDASQRVKDALAAQKLLYEQHLSELVLDPHANLPTERLSKEDSMHVIRTLLSENRQNWSVRRKECYP